MNIITRFVAWVSPWYNEEEVAKREQRTNVAANEAKKTIIEAKLLLADYRRGDGLIATHRSPA